MSNYETHRANAKPTRVYSLPDTLTKDQRELIASKGIDLVCLTPEMVAVALAKTSRSPLSFEVNAGLITEESASTFHDKYVLGYGHASVAELATANVCVEGISMLAAKAIEDGRLGSYIEQSTRYQIWPRDGFIIPPDMEFGAKHIPIKKGPFTPNGGWVVDRSIIPTREAYVRHCFKLFDTYLGLMPLVIEKLKAKNPKPDSMSDTLYESNMKAKACDLLRGLLPASARCNVGYVANARTLEHAITKLMSHQLEEMQFLGCRIKDVAQAKLPTLVKYADFNEYRMGFHQRFEMIAEKVAPRRNKELYVAPTVALQANLPLEHAHLTYIAQALYPHTDRPLSEIIAALLGLNHIQVMAMWNALFEERSKIDGAPRALEDHPFTFDTVMDFGCWRDLQRHRMTTQFDQTLTPYLGYSVPEEIVEFGFEDVYREAIDGTLEVFEMVVAATDHLVAQYCVPMIFNKRSVFKMNLRELHSLVELRTKPGGHLNYRRAAYRMYEEVKTRFPVLVNNLRAHEVEAGDDLKRIKEVKS